MGPYAYKGNQWVSFDDRDSLRAKTRWIRERGLGGGMIWALDLDDFNGVCSQGKYPLLTVIADGLNIRNNAMSSSTSAPEGGEMSGGAGSSTSVMTTTSAPSTTVATTQGPEVSSFALIRSDRGRVGTKSTLKNMKLICLTARAS